MLLNLLIIGFTSLIHVIYFKYITLVSFLICLNLLKSNLTIRLSIYYMDKSVILYLLFTQIMHYSNLKMITFIICVLSIPKLLNYIHFSVFVV